MATVSQLPASCNLVCTVGNDFTLTLAVTENGSTWNSTGATLATDIIARDGTVVATDFTAAATDGQVTLTLTDANTTALGVGVYSHRLSVTKSGNTRDWIAGTLSVVEAGIGGTTSSAASLSITTGEVALSTTTLVAPAAANISVADAGGYYTGDDVEEVLGTLGHGRRSDPSPFAAFKNRLDLAGLGGPATVTLTGDSTGNDTTDWFYRFLQSVATLYPGWTVEHRAWRDTTSDYGPATYVQTGTAGKAYYTPGTSVTCALNPPPSGTTVSSADMRIQAHVRLTSLSPGTNQVIAAHFGAAGLRAWRFYIDTSGRLVLEHSADGTALVSQIIASSVQMSSQFTAGTDIYIGCTFTRNNGSNCVAQAIASTDGVTWSNFGTAVTGTSIAGMFATSAQIEVGSRTGGTDPLGGRVYWVEVYKGTASTDTLAWRFDAGLYDGGTTFTDSESRTWTLSNATLITKNAPVFMALNASVSGQGISYFDNVSRRAAVLVGPSDLLIVNSGHNEGSENFGATLATYITNAKAVIPSAGIVVCKQNPQSTTATNYRRHARSMAKLGLQASSNAWGVIDAFQAFQDTGDPDAYVTAGDVHPTTPAGYDLWRDEALRSFSLA